VRHSEMSQLPLNGGWGVPRTWKKRTPEFKQQALERMQEAKDLGLLAKELCVSVRTLYRWKDIQLGRVKKIREPKPHEKKLEEEIQRLKQSLANRTLEVDFFKGALQRVKARRQRNTASGGEASTTKSED
jgi:transposase-like protein